jgi:hypothetical protein
MCSLLIIILLITILNVNITYHFPPTMAIKTCAASSKNKPAGRALNATAATPVEQHKERHTTRLPKSPWSNNINALLAEINRPTARPTIRLDNIPQALHPTTNNNPIDHGAKHPKNITGVWLSVGVEATETEAANTSDDEDLTDSPSQPRVCISNVAETVNNNISPAAPPASRRSILQQPTIRVG